MARALRRGHAPSAAGHPPGLFAAVSELLDGEDAVLRSIREETPERGLPPISIGPDEGRLLSVLAQACGARKAVEVGTLAGYSACWIARALPEDGILHTLEYEPKHAAVARENLERVGLSRKVVVHEGPAVKTLPGLARDGPFDLCFIDADKVGYPLYLEWAVANVRSGGLVVGDNAYLFGRLHLEGRKGSEDAAQIAAMRKFLRALADPRHFSSCAMIPTGEGMAVGVRR